MDSLNTIPNSGSFGDVSAKLNDNFSKVGQSLTTLENVAIANKGYFDTLASLQAAFPSPKAGNIAYVANVASSTGYYIYNVVSGVWTATTTEAPAVNVAISNYAQHGYSSSPKTLKQVEDEVIQLAGEKVDINYLFTYQDTTSKSYSEKVGDSVTAKITLINNTPVVIDGLVKKIKIRTAVPGPIGVVIFRPTGTTNRFKTISVTSITVVAGTSTTDVSIPVLAGDFIGFAHNSGASIPNFGGTGGDGFFQLMNYPALNAEYTFAYVAGAWVAGTFLIEAGRFTTSEQVEVIAQSVAQTALNKQYIEITATRNAADFNSIRGIVAGITDASENKVYVINVPNGRWFECDLNGKKNVIIRGQDKDETIIYCDGLSTKVVPADYSWGYSGQTLASIPRDRKHIVFMMTDLNLQNITLEANDAKYCIHNDAPISKMALKCENVKLKGIANINNVLGIGLNGGQSIEMKSCEFIMPNANNHSIYFHNWNNQTKGCKLSIRDSFFNSNYIQFEELGSDYTDIVELLNCASSKAEPNVLFGVANDGSDKTFWTNPATGLKETDPTLVPYCIKLYSNGTQIIGASSAVFGSLGLSRPDFANYVVGKLL